MLPQLSPSAHPMGALLSLSDALHHSPALSPSLPPPIALEPNPTPILALQQYQQISVGPHSWPIKLAQLLPSGTEGALGNDQYRMQVEHVNSSSGPHSNTTPKLGDPMPTQAPSQTLLPSPPLRELSMPPEQPGPFLAPD
ncbi:hypothetical protein E4T56_gene1715 [Termitomyces sp. T112]|nr:hypothetical protein E4T56_gene1715 [Termitomyces sp. T112]